MLSRVADCAYWLSRYLERAEHTARLGDVCLSLTLDRSPDTVRRLIATLGTAPAGYGFTKRPVDAAGRADGERLDLAHRDAIVACVAAARENARQVREQISSEMWEQLNRMYLEIRRAGADNKWQATPHRFFRDVKEGAHLFQGITDSTL